MHYTIRVCTGITRSFSKFSYFVISILQLRVFKFIYIIDMNKILQDLLRVKENIKRNILTRRKTERIDLN